MPNLNELCGQPSRQALSMGSPSGLIPENQPARKASLSPGRYKDSSEEEQGRAGRYGCFLWTNPERLPRSRWIFSTVERAEGRKGGEAVSPWHGEEQACHQQALQLR